MNSRNHSITIIFPLMLFLLFVSMAISVILFAARIYDRNVASANDNFQTSTTLSYLAEKIHAFDTPDGVQIGTFDQLPALILTETVNGTVYHTYIYQNNSELYELTSASDETLSPDAGSPILTVDDVQFSIRDRVVTLSCRNTAGEVISTKVVLRSGST